MHSSIADSVLAVPAFAPVALPAAATAGILVDTNGWDGCLFVIHTASVAGGATLDAYVKKDSASAFTTSSNVTNAALVQITSAAANTNAVFNLDVYRPGSRYLKLVLTSGAASVTVAATALLYKRAGTIPATAIARQTVRVVDS